MSGFAPNGVEKTRGDNRRYPFFMGIAALKFKSGDMEAMGKNLGGSAMLFLVPKIVEVIVAWAAQ